MTEILDHLFRFVVLPTIGITTLVCLGKVLYEDWVKPTPELLTLSGRLKELGGEGCDLCGGAVHGYLEDTLNHLTLKLCKRHWLSHKKLVGMQPIESWS